MGVTFLATSGTEFKQKFPGTEFEIFNFATGAGNSTRNRIGFFGNTGPGSPVNVGTYQLKTYPTDGNGSLQGAPLVQMKFISTAVVQVSGVYNASTAEVPSQSGTVLIRFIEPNTVAVQTQDAFLEAVRIKNDNIQQQVQPANLNVQAFETRHPFNLVIDHPVWIKIAGSSSNGAGGATNQLELTDHSWTSVVHDHFVCLSVAPTAAGTNNEFAFYYQVSYF